MYKKRIRSIILDMQYYNIPVVVDTGTSVESDAFLSKYIYNFNTHQLLEQLLLLKNAVPTRETCGHTRHILYACVRYYVMCYVL